MSSMRTLVRFDDAPGPLSPRPGPESELSVKRLTSEAAVHSKPCLCALRDGLIRDLLCVALHLRLLLHSCLPENCAAPLLPRMPACDMTRSI